MATALALTLIVLPAAEVAAWGASGHRMVGQAAMRALPEELPAFLRTAEAAAQVGELSREPDRWKGAGQPHGRERDTAHFVDMIEDGRIMT
ncbi:MAG TPA: S1/P1 Nuclease, partial [Brevundimonas sp.]|nr:S1/P1 Nuclease [Brevundimonas sp.]